MRQILGGYKGRRIELEAEKEGGLKYLQTIEQNSDGSSSSAQNRPTELAGPVKRHNDSSNVGLWEYQAFSDYCKSFCLLQNSLLTANLVA